MTIGLIYGGRSGEHEISLVSAASIARGMSKENKVVLIAITKDGKWYLQDDEEYKRVCKDEKAAFQIKADEKNAVTIVPGGKKDAFMVNGKSLQIDCSSLHLIFHYLKMEQVNSIKQSQLAKALSL